MGGIVSSGIESGGSHGTAIVSFSYPPADVSPTMMKKETNKIKVNRYFITRINYYC